MKKLNFRRKQPDSTPSRITNDTVAEHREKILAGGRRYKYPLQYAKHRLVVNAVIIALVAFVVLILLGWWQLYIAQNSNTFFYRVTQVAPLPVAHVNGTAVRYSDYMLYYRPSEYYLNRYDEIKADSEDGQLQLAYKKREALDRAIADAYARSIADEHDLSINSDEVNKAISSLRQADNGQLTEDAVNSSAQRVFGMTEQDVRSQYRNGLLRSKAAFAVDDNAKAIVGKVETTLRKNNQNLKATADALNKDKKDSVQYGVSGLVRQSFIFGGLRVSEIAAFKQGEVKGPIMSATDDGYYFVEVIEKSDTLVNFAYIRVPLTEFRNRLAQLREDGKINEYITIDIDQPESNQEEE